jgi:hypothetical protein
MLTNFTVQVFMIFYRYSQMNLILIYDTFRNHGGTNLQTNLLLMRLKPKLQSSHFFDRFPKVINFNYYPSIETVPLADVTKWNGHLIHKMESYVDC